jgi:hypothetical protein
MATDLAVPTGTDDPRTTVPSSVRWLLPGLTLLLAGLAVYQLLFVTPRFVFVLDHLGAPRPGSLMLMLSLAHAVPEWSFVLAALAVGVFAFWQRDYVGRSALLATILLAVNVGLLITVFNCLFRVVYLMSLTASPASAP